MPDSGTKVITGSFSINLKENNMKTAQALAAIVLIAWGSTGQAGSDEQAVAVVDKALRAHGGEQKLAGIKGQAWKGKGYIELLGNKQDYTADYIFAPPNRVRFDMHIEAFGKKVMLTVATDGKDAYEQSGELLRDMEKTKRDEFLHTAYVVHISQLYPLKDKAFTLTSLGESKLGDEHVVGVKVARQGRRDVSLYFDKDSSLLVKTSTRVFDEFSKKEVTQDTLRSGYRDRDGLKVFDKMIIQRDAKTFIVEEFSDQRILEKVDPTIFAKPR
jgi:hypothetical protein